jgi:23S rRNA pseudouridine1911/1915/1917 synthase
MSETLRHRAIATLPVGNTIRLDRYIADTLGILRRSQLKTRNMRATVNGKPVKLSRLVKNGDTLALEWDAEREAAFLPENIPLDVLYEDSRVIVLNKAQGMVVHPGAGNHSGTLANALLYRCIAEGRPSEWGRLRPFIVHRLDKDTSGVMIAAWDADELFFLQSQFKERLAKKTYAAITVGSPPEDSGVVSTYLVRDPGNRKRFAVRGGTARGGEGKLAVTRYRVIRRFAFPATQGNRRTQEYALLALRPQTGRTHQLRVHLKHLGCPIAGDPIYGAPHDKPPSLMLHAKTLKIALSPGACQSVFTSRLPRRFGEFMRCRP